MVENTEAIEEMSFKQAMDELDSIVFALEGNSLELEESLVQYERGVALLVSLQSRLSDAQQKVDVLMGQLEQAPEDSVVDSTLS